MTRSILHSITRFRLPESYLVFMNSRDGFEGYLGDDWGYCVIWSVENVISAYAGYKMAEYLDRRHYAFGTDGGDEMLVFDLSLPGDGIIKLPFIGMSAEEPMEYCDSFAELAAATSGPDLTSR